MRPRISIRGSDCLSITLFYKNLWKGLFSTADIDRMKRGISWNPYTHKRAAKINKISEPQWWEKPQHAYRHAHAQARGQNWQDSGAGMMRDGKRQRYRDDKSRHSIWTWRDVVIVFGQKSLSNSFFKACLA